MAKLSRGVEYINGTYKPGVVYNYFKGKKDYNMIIGFDFGDGECTFTLLVKKEIANPETGKKSVTWEEKHIYVPDNNRVPTVLAYKTKTVKVEKAADETSDGVVATEEKTITECFIGNDALTFPNYFFQFKQFPGIDLFDKPYPGTDIKYKKLMSDFIKTLWKNVMDEKTNEHIKDNISNTLVVVGYPAGGKWTKEKKAFGKDAVQKYRDFLYDCLKCDVVTIPEPTAAIFGSIYDKFPEGFCIPVGNNGKIILSDGVCVYEPGSSTLDFSYIIVGKKIITSSTYCAGRDIDRVMFEYITHKNRLKAGKDYNKAQVKKFIYVLKGHKEDFYEKLKINPDYEIYHALDFQMKNAAGQWDKNCIKPVSFKLNREFFDNALSFPFKKDLLTTVEWKKEVNEFVVKSKEKLLEDKDEKYICNKVIVSGGTGNVTQFQEIIKNNFNWDKNLVCISKDPVMSVSRGLAYIKALEFTAAGKIEEYVGQMQDGTHKGVEAAKEKRFNEFAEEVSEKLAKTIIDAYELTCAGCVNSKDNSWTADEFKDLLSPNVSKIKAKEGIDDAYLAKELWKIFESVNGDLIEEANTVAKEVYKCYLDETEKDKFTPVVELKDTEPNFTGLDSDDTKKLMETMVHISADKNFARVAFNGSFLNQMVVFKYLNGGKFRKDKLQVKLRELRDNEKRTDLHNKVKRSVRKSITRNDKIKKMFSEYVKIQAEIYLGKALLVLSDS